MTTPMDRAILAEKIVALVADNTDHPRQGATVLCAAVAMLWLGSAGREERDAHMIAQFSEDLADAVQTFRGGISAQSLRALQ